MDKLFLVELSGGNIRHCELELPATDYELLDALDKLRLSAADKLYFDICDYSIVWNLYVSFIRPI